MKKIDKEEFIIEKFIRIIIFIYETRIIYSKNFKILFIKRKRYLKCLNYDYRFDFNILYANIKYLFYEEAKALFNIEIYEIKENAIEKN